MHLREHLPAQIDHALAGLHLVGIRKSGAALGLVVGDAVLGGTAARRRIGRIIVEHAHVALTDHRLIALDIRSATGSGDTGRTDVVLIPVKEELLGIVAELGITGAELHTPELREIHPKRRHRIVAQIIELRVIAKEELRGTLIYQLQQQATECRAQFLRDLHFPMPNKTDLHTTHHTNSFDVAKRH